MTNVPVTDADREALWLRLLDSCKGGPQWEYARACEDADAQAIARARAEGAASERAACAEYADNYALFGRNGVRIAKAIRARSEGGKA